MTDPLSLLAEKHHTDKAAFAHNYTPLYNYLLEPIREKVRKVMEIGVFDGASVKMWSDYFPNATVWGVDIHNHGCVLEREFPRIRIIDGDATHKSIQERIKKELLEAEPLKEGFDFIVDDGSHYPAEVRAAYYAYWPMMKKGGYYVIEDMAPIGNNHAMWVLRADIPDRWVWADQTVIQSVEANKW